MMEKVQAANGYTRNITTTLVVSSTFRAVSKPLSLCFTARTQNARKRKSSTQAGDCRVTERRCGWRGTRGAASCDGGRS